MAGAQPIFFCDTPLPMLNYDSNRMEVSTTYSRSIEQLAANRSAVLLSREDPTFVALQEVWPLIQHFLFLLPVSSTDIKHINMCSCSVKKGPR